MNTIYSVTPTNLYGSKYFLITIDVEDWFQVENFKPWIPFETWDQREIRVERNINRLLDLFDSVKFNSTGTPRSHSQVKIDRRTVAAEEQDLRSQMDSEIEPSSNYNKMHTAEDHHSKKVCGTFFVLCWIAKRLPHIVREITARGHEVASHGCYHELPKKMPLESLTIELKDSRKRLEDAIGRPVVGFRAPSFSINDAILKAVAKTGYLYDSSYNSFSLHGRYGKISFNGSTQIGIAHRINDSIWELPISNLNLNGSVVPLGGGAYFRLFPFYFFRLGVKSILKRDNAYLFYIHPWEIDPEQPRVTEASLNHKLRHYTMLSKTYNRLDKIIDAFKHCHFITCSQYLDAQDIGIASSG